MRATRVQTAVAPPLASKTRARREHGHCSYPSTAGPVRTWVQSKAIRIAHGRGPPSVTLTGPADGATVNSTVNVTATASDNVAVAGVQFLLDGANLGAEDTTAPYSFSWNTTTAARGFHTLSARVRDTSGNTATAASFTITVAPRLTITAPANNATLTGPTVNVTYTTTGSVRDQSRGIHFGRRSDAFIGP